MTCIDWNNNAQIGEHVLLLALQSSKWTWMCSNQCKIIAVLQRLSTFYWQLLDDTLENARLRLLIQFINTYWATSVKKCAFKCSGLIWHFFEICWFCHLTKLSSTYKCLCLYYFGLDIHYKQRLFYTKFIEGWRFVWHWVNKSIWLFVSFINHYSTTVPTVFELLSSICHCH